MPVDQTPDTDAIADLCERVRRFVDEVAIPAESPAIARDVAALDRCVARLRDQARQAGLYAPQLPVAWGGLGLGWSALAQVLEAAGRGKNATCGPWSAPNSAPALP
ncbi:hypothetical protein G6F57_019458 [Rhizopus arrhizus]|nr:hypothetical protein G6F57_019458 [Rhizopus arrhizus]